MSDDIKKRYTVAWYAFRWAMYLAMLAVGLVGVMTFGFVSVHWDLMVTNRWMNYEDRRHKDTEQ